MEPILEVKDLTKKFPQQGKGDFLAVDHISFRLDRLTHERNELACYGKIYHLRV